MTIGQKVFLKSMPEEGLLEVIGKNETTDQFCLRFVDTPRCAIWARDEDVKPLEVLYDPHSKVAFWGFEK